MGVALFTPAEVEKVKQKAGKASSMCTVTPEAYARTAEEEFMEISFDVPMPQSFQPNTSKEWKGCRMQVKA